MRKSQKRQEEERRQNSQHNEQPELFKSSTIKDIIAPSGIDVSNIDRLEIISNIKRYARSFCINFAKNVYIPGVI